MRGVSSQEKSGDQLRHALKRKAGAPRKPLSLQATRWDSLISLVSLFSKRLRQPCGYCSLALKQSNPSIWGYLKLQLNLGSLPRFADIQP
jgi:hypothetical protein